MNATDSSPPASRHDAVSPEKKPAPFAVQIEFEFAVTVTVAPQKKRRNRKASPSARSKAAESESNAEGCREHRTAALSGGMKDASFGDDWIEDVCWNITQAKNLREAVTLSACYLAELIDFEVEKRGYCDEWKQAYSAYCSVQLFSFTSEEDEKIELPGLAWAWASLIFEAYERSSELTDWHLFEELCSGEMDLEDSDEEGAEAYTINLFSGCLWAIHDIVCNGGAEVFSSKDSCSAQ